MSSAASCGTRRGGRRASGGDRSNGGGIRGTGSEAGGATAVASVNNDRDGVAGGGEVSNNGSTTTEGGGGSADEPGMTRKRKRMANRAGRGPPQRSVHPTPADSERWFTNTHLAMVMILAEIYTDLEDRHLRSHDEYKEAEEAWEGYMHRIKDVGQEVNAFAKSRVQTHLLISNTVQLCHRMAADKNCHLAKDYPPGDESDFEYDFSTDENTDGEDGEEGDSSMGRPAKDDSKVANGGGVSNGKAKKVQETGDGGGGRESGPTDKCHRGSLRERYDALVVCLVERSRWNAERPGRPHKDVITRAREVMMAIFIDSYYRKMLSREMLEETLGNLERIIALGDAAGDGEEGGAEVKVDLGDGLPLSKIGLANIALTPPE